MALAVVSVMVDHLAGVSAKKTFAVLVLLVSMAYKKTSRKILLGIIALFLFAFIAVQTDVVQNWLTGIVTEKLSKELGTEVKIRNVSLSFFNSFNMEGILIRDKQKDTLVYAGALKVRITDWFFLKDKNELKYIGLEDATIKLRRKDSVWNYQFLIDHFASSSPRKKSNSTIDLDLKKIDLKNVTLVKTDLWRGERINAKVASLILDADNINFLKKQYAINDITIDKPYFAITGLPALRPDSLIPKSYPKTGTGLQLNSGDIKLNVTNLTIKNGILSIQSNEDRPDTYFDGSHIYITRLNGKFNNITLIKDTLQSTVNITAKERSGLELKRLKAKFRVTPRIMEFAKMDLQTNKSRINGYYAMKYKAFNNDFGDYINKVVMDARFKDAKINSDDIAFFAPELKKWNKEVSLTGNAFGTVADFSVKDFFAKAGNTTYIHGILTMKGLPDINTTIINFNNGIFKSNYNDLSVFIPVLKEVHEPNLAALGDILYRGNFNGSINNFTATGNISSNLGAITTDVTMKINKEKDAFYSGTFTTTQFNIGKFFDYDSLGLVDFNGKIKGNNFSLNNLKTTIEGNISRLDFNGYTYHNIVTNGTFQKKYFNGEVKIDDPNLDFKSQIEIDLSKQQPSFNILGDLVKSNLKPLHFVKDNLSFTGLLDIDFTGTNIDNFAGVAKLLNADIKNDVTELSFDSLDLTSGYNNKVKFLNLASNEFNATISGEFNILDLPTSFQSFLHRYYPSYFDAPRKIPVNQNFSILINTNYIEPFLKLYDKKLGGANEAVIKGTVDTRKNIFSLDFKLPYIKYDHYSITGVDITGIGNLDSLALTGYFSSTQASDSLFFPNTKISVHSGNDHSVVSLKTNTGNNTLNDADINADVFTLKDGVRIHFNPSAFILNDKTWNLEKQGEIVIRKNSVSAQNVKFTQGFQEIGIETGSEDKSTQDNLTVKLKKVVLGDITALFFKNPKIEGLTNGEIQLRNFYNNFTVTSHLTVEQFRLDDDSIGLIQIQGGYDSKSGTIPFSVQSQNKGFGITATGHYNIKDSTGHPLMVNSKLDNANIDYINNFLGDIFSNITGYATGDLTVSGDPSSPELSGKVKLTNAGMKVNYTQVYYTISPAEVKFDKDGIDFGELTIHDTLKNSATIKGKLYETGFKNMSFDFDLSTQKMLLIDTKPRDNQQFYGKAIGKATLSFKGPENNCKMTIVAEANDSSHIYIPNSVNKESGEADFIVFKQYGTAMEASKSKSNFNLLADLDITATNKMKIDVILDELSGDVIKATGDGRLRIRAGTTEPLTIRGRYNIDNGNYDFNFQSFIRKPFVLKSESGNYIEWNGDPFNANIHIDAQYTAENISVGDLISNLGNANGFNGSSKAYRGPVYVIASLTDKLSKPTIKFRLDFPQGSPIKSDPVFDEFLNKIEKDDNEIVKQVTSLIVFGAFTPYGQGNGIGSINFSSVTVNTISQALTNQLNKTLSNILFKITHDKSLHVDIGTAVYSSANLISQSQGGSNTSTNNFDRSRINLKVGYSFFQDKLVVTFGGDFDFNLSATAAAQSGNLQWLPDLNVEYYLTNDKKLRFIAFNKNSLDVGTGTTLGKQNRQGVGISYKRDFEHSPFEKTKKQPAKKPDEIELAPVADSISSDVH
jgi:hypothetical protein